VFSGVLFCKKFVSVKKKSIPIRRDPEPPGSQVPKKSADCNIPGSVGAAIDFREDHLLAPRAIERANERCAQGPAALEALIHYDRPSFGRRLCPPGFLVEGVIVYT